MSKKKEKKKKENKYKVSSSSSKKGTPKQKKKKVQINKAKIHVICSYNNTTLTASDMNGSTIAWSTPGAVGFTGSRKSTAYAATKAAEDLVAKMSKYGVKQASVIVKGTGMGRQAAVKGLFSAGLKVVSLSDHTPIPHGGTSPRKKPRGS